MVTHYLLSDQPPAAYLACVRGKIVTPTWIKPVQITTDPLLVTCRRCQRSHPYKRALQQPIARRHYGEVDYQVWVTVLRCDPMGSVSTTIENDDGHPVAILRGRHGRSQAIAWAAAAERMLRSRPGGLRVRTVPP